MVNKCDVIMVGDVEYIPKIETSDEYFIVRTYSAGVFFGNIESRNGKNRAERDQLYYAYV